VNKRHETLTHSGTQHFCGLCIIGEPPGNPMSAEAKGVGGVAEVERDIAGGQQLLEFGDFDVRRGRRDNADSQGGRKELPAFKFELFFVPLGPIGFGDPVEPITDHLACLALIDNEAPGRELAVIGNAAGNGQHLGQLFRRWAGPGQKRRSDGASG